MSLSDCPANPVGALRRTAETTHLLAIAVWFGAVAMSAVVAAVVFPLMRDLDPTLGAYPAFEGDHAVLAGGHVGARVFLIADIVQFVCGLIVLATTIALVGFLKLPTRRWSSAIRITAVGGAVLVASYHVMVLAPRMDDNLKSYWTLAEHGETEQAEAARARFSADHPTASRTLSGTAALLLVAFVSGAWSAQGREREAG
ncbi:MAG: hypothetical protein RIB60_05160 [Phycisphaerales bacterium]